jgi:hypothetical protein
LLLWQLHGALAVSDDPEVAGARLVPSDWLGGGLYLMGPRQTHL